MSFNVARSLHKIREHLDKNCLFPIVVNEGQTRKVASPIEISRMAQKSQTVPLYSLTAIIGDCLRVKSYQERQPPSIQNLLARAWRRGVPVSSSIAWASIYNDSIIEHGMSMFRSSSKKQSKQREINPRKLNLGWSEFFSINVYNRHVNIKFINKISNICKEQFKRINAIYLLFR